MEKEKNSFVFRVVHIFLVLIGRYPRSAVSMMERFSLLCKMAPFQLQQEKLIKCLKSFNRFRADEI